MKKHPLAEEKHEYWTRRYEQLREQVVAAAGGFIVSDRWGLSVLTRRGMSAWMQTWCDPLVARPAVTGEQQTFPVDHGNAWRREATALLANMAFNAVTPQSF